MNRTLLGVCTAVIMSAAILGAQSKPADSENKAPDSAKSGAIASASTVTFTGCLNPGSKSDPFFLTSAKEKGVKGEATTVKLVPANKKVGLDTFLTHDVEVTGTLDKAGTTPTLTVTKVKSRSDQC
jgi:hypothetical protein